MKDDLKYEIVLPSEVQASQEGTQLILKGPKGETRRELFHPAVKLSLKNDKIELDCKKATKREKTLVHTFRAHIRNMVKGVQEPFLYKLRICAGPPQSHFPAQVTIKDSVFSIKNFLGEKVPRDLKLRDDVKVTIEGDEVLVESASIEAAGRTASEIELLTKTKSKDKRIFQDGIYIVKKP